MKYNLANNTWGIQEIKALNEVIKSGRYTMGPKVKQFEEEFAAYHGKKHAIMVNSGSSANLLAVASLVHTGALKSGDEVIVPAVSWSTTYFPLSQYGLKLIFVDIDDTLNIDIQQLQEAIKRPKVKAVMGVNLLGNPMDVRSVVLLCRNNGLIFIEDNCESLGAVAPFDKGLTGTFGDIGTFSFFFSHHMQTMEGGMILTDDDQIEQVCRSLRAHGWTRDLPEDNLVCEKMENPFYDSFRFATMGYSVRPLEMSGAVGSVQLKKLDGFIEGRRDNAEFFEAMFKYEPWCRIQKETGLSSWFGFAIILDGALKGKRDKVVELLQDNNVEVRPIVAGNFTRNPVIEKIDYEVVGDLSVANDIHDNGFFIGNEHTSLIEKIDMVYMLLLDMAEELT